MRGGIPVSLALLWALSSSAGAQAVFEVTSIRKVVSPDVIYGIRPVDPAGRFHAIITVHDLIVIAYGSPLALVPAQIIDAPSWAKNDRFEIVAKAPGALSHDNLLAMMQRMLADRFQLRLRKETRQLPVYDLVLDRAGQTGPRLRKADGTCLTDPKGVAADLLRAWIQAGLVNRNLRTRDDVGYVRERAREPSRSTACCPESNRADRDVRH